MSQKLINLLVGIMLLASLLGYSSPSKVSAAEATPIGKDLPYATDHLIIKLRPEVNLDKNGLATHVSSLDRTLADLKAVAFSPLQGVAGTYRLEMSKNADIHKAVATLSADPAVEYAEPDYLAKLATAPDDPRYGEQWGLSKIQVEGAWAQTQGSPAIVIAIIDSGIDLTHEDLSPNLWVNPGEIAGNLVDDDNNGLIDDVQGWNFVSATNDVQDFNGHGSLVAGIAAARTGNGLGIAGVCGNCRIMPVKITQLSGFANYSDIAAGIYYAADKGAKVINLSVGGYADSITVRNAVNYALSKNIVVMGGAGNDNKSDKFYPAAYEGVIAVAGTDNSDVRVSSSNYGDWVDVSAPGQNILSTTLGDYSSDNGTSYATPFVSGITGLLLTQHPDWTPAMIRAQFMHTSDAIDTQNPTFVGQLGSGRLNATSAMQPSHPILNYLSYTGNGTPNLRPDFGSTVSLNVTLNNTWADAIGVTGTLSSTDGFVTITGANASFGNILAGTSQANATAFTFNIAAGASYNHAMPFSLALTSNGGAYTTTLNFTITTRSSEELFTGTIDTNTTWTSDKTYKLTGNVGVAPGYTLTIEPGTVVKFAGNYSLNIGGTLVARGTPAQPIRFEPYAASGSWNRIHFDNTSQDAQATADGVYQSGNVLQYVMMTKATGGIVCTTATPFLEQLTTDGGGLDCSLGASDLWLQDSTLVGAVSITLGGSTLEHLVRVNTSGGTVTIPASQVKDSNFGGALTIQGNGQVNNTTTKNLTINGTGDVQQVTANGSIWVSSGQVLNSATIKGGISIGSTSTISNCTVNWGGISAGDGSTITRNNIEKSSGAGISTSGSSTVTFNRVVGTGQGIVATAGAAENNLIANTTGDGLQPGTASVRNNTFIGIKGNAIYLTGVPTAFEYNNFEFNTGTFDVYITVLATQTVNLEAQNNWWGTTDSNLIKLRTRDYYDDYTLAKLITSPTLTNPSQTAPAYVQKVTLDPASPVGIQTVNFTVQFSKPMDITSSPMDSFAPNTGNTWKARTNMPAEAGYQVAAASNGKIYAIGGPKVVEYDPLTDTWSTKLSSGRSGIAVANDGKIYSIGGDSVEAYDPITDTWTQRTNMPTPRVMFGATTANNGKIYAIGGHYEGYSYIIEEYDPLTNAWATKKPMPTARLLLGVIGASNGKIYAIGGDTNSYEGTGIVEEFDPLPNTWATRSNMLTARKGMGVALASNGKIYVIGGQGGCIGCAISSVEEYDPLTDTWAIKLNIPTGGYLKAVTANNGKIYIMDGISVLEYTPPSWGIVELNSNPQWQDATHFSVSYDFSTLDPRGDYTLTVKGASGSDGILIAPDNRTTFTVDYAGEISDTTPPTAPSVSAWGNGGLTQLTARATANDPDSLIVGYRYAIGTTPGGSDVVNWTNTASNSITRTGLLLRPDQAYYITFQARNASGLWSPFGVSNSVVNGVSVNYLYLPITRGN